MSSLFLGNKANAELSALGWWVGRVGSPVAGFLRQFLKN